MPGMDGITATQELRKRQPPERRSYVVAMTANATQDDREACLKAGMDCHLPKPVRKKRLAEVLEQGAALRFTPQ